MRFRKSKSQPDDEGYYPAILSTELSQDSAKRLTINGQAILLTKHEGEFYAFSAYCPHAAGDLAEGQIYRGRIDCPDHGYRFDICSGTTIWPPDESYRLKTYPVKVAAGLVQVKLSS